MSTVKMDTHEVDRIIRNLAANGAHVVNRIGNEILEDADRRVPIRTGALFLSGSLFPASPGEPTAIVSFGREDDVEYAGYVEFGTSKMRARPYFQPAIEAVASRHADGRVFDEGLLK